MAPAAGKAIGKTSKKDFSQFKNNSVLKPIFIKDKTPEIIRVIVKDIKNAVLWHLDDYFTKPREINSQNFVSTNATIEAEKTLNKVLSIREKQKDGIFSDKIVGLNGVLLQGDSGIGKSEMILAILQDKKISEIKLDEEDNKKISDKLFYYKIDANMTLQKKTEIITKAYETGNIIWIDELNSCIDDGFEKILNLALTGDHPQGKYVEAKAGFMLISSVNSIELEGRSPISPALLHRLNVVQAKSLKEYSIDDMTKIIDNMASQNDALISNQNYSSICREIACDFIEIKKTKEGRNFNLRSIENNLDDIFTNYFEYNQPCYSSLKSAAAEKLLYSQTFNKKLE